MKVFKS